MGRQPIAKLCSNFFHKHLRIYFIRLIHATLVLCIGLLNLAGFAPVAVAADANPEMGVRTNPAADPSREAAAPIAEQKVTPQPTPRPIMTPFPGEIKPTPMEEKPPGDSEKGALDESGITWIFNGDATDDWVVPGRITLTADLGLTRGSAWNAEKIDLTKNFDKYFIVYVGDKDDAPFPNDPGADGIAFVLQNQGTDALGLVGGGLGFETISPSLGVEIDTYWNSENWDPSSQLDHFSVNENGSVDHGYGAGTAVTVPQNLEDDREHLLRVVWNAGETRLKVYFDGELILTHTADLINNIFAGENLVWYGLTAATASAWNMHYFAEAPPILDETTHSGDGTKHGIWDDREACFIDKISGATGTAGDPINTHTGGFDYAVGHLPITTVAGPLVFQRTYSSLATAAYTKTLGPGWTHNLDTRLIFPSDPGGVEGVVLFKSHSANLYRFLDNGDNTYSPYPGLCTTLTFEAGSDTYRVVDRAQRTYIFDANGVLQSWSDSQGHAFIYTYTGGRLSAVTGPSGQRYLSLAYDPGVPDQLASVSDHTGRQVTFGYDPVSDNLETVTDELERVWTYVYSGTLLTEVRDPDDELEVRIDYEGGRAVRQYDGANNLIVDLTYHADGTTLIQDGRGYTATHTYDIRNTLIGSTNPLSGTVAKEYDYNFQPNLITDPAGNATQLDWSLGGHNLEQLVNAAGYTTTMTYDGLNNLTAVVDGRGYTTTYAYSGTLLTSSVDIQGHTTVYTYTTAADAPQPAGLLKEVRDPQGNLTQYSYDQFGQRTAVTDALTNTIAYAYDDLGRLIKATLANGRSDWTCYDDLGRVVRTVQHATGDGGTPATDPCHPDYVPSTDPVEDRPTNYYFDHKGNPIATADPAGRITRTYYDANNRASAVVRNLVGDLYLETWPAYDPAFPDRNIRTEMVYDENGNQIATRAVLDDAPLDTVVTRTFYDELNRPTAVVRNLTGDLYLETWPAYDPAFPDQNVRTEMIYDANGNQIATLTVLDDSPLETAVTRTYYDELNRVKAVVRNLVGDLYAPTWPAYDPAFPDQNVRTEMVYDANDNQIATVDPLGRVTRTYYDELNRPKAVVRNLVGDVYLESWPAYDPAFPDQNVRTELIYDENGNQIAILAVLDDTPLDVVVTRTYYDELNRAKAVVRNLVGDLYLETWPAYDPAFPDRNVRTEMIYDELGNQIATLEPLGRVTRTYYDDLNRATAVVRNLTGDLYLETWPAYDPAFPDRNVRTEMIYDELGNQIATIAVLNDTPLETSVTRTYYDELNRVKATVQNLVGDLYTPTWPAYDPAFPDENVRAEMIYAATGNQIATLEVLNDAPLETIATRTYYDELNRPIATVRNLVGDLYGPTWPAYDPAFPDENVRAEMVYAATGNQVATIEVLDDSPLETVVARTYYDGLSRPVTVVANLTGQGISAPTPPPRDFVNPDQNVRTDTSYDAAGHQVLQQDANGVDTVYEYDAQGRLAAVVENYQLGGSVDHETNVRTEYTYDAVGNLRTILDGNAHTTTFDYDKLNRLIGETDPLLHFWETEYDAAGNRVALTDANLAKTNYAYDALNRLQEINYADDPEVDVTFAYDALGRRTGMTDEQGKTDWTYDGLGRPLVITDTFGSVVKYAYDPAGNRSALTYPNAEKVSYEYDDLHRLTLVTDWDTQETQYTYDAAGQLATVTRPNGVLSTYDYDALGRVSYLSHEQGKDTHAYFDYTYDPLGNRKQIVEVVVTPSATKALQSEPALTPAPVQEMTPIPTASATVAQPAAPNPTATIPPPATPSEPATATPAPTLPATPAPTGTATSFPTWTPTTNGAALNLADSFLAVLAQQPDKQRSKVGAWRPATAAVALNPVPDLAALPLGFIPNRGQSVTAVSYQAHGLGGQLYFTPDELVLVLPTGKTLGVPPLAKYSAGEGYASQSTPNRSPVAVVRLQYDGANPEVAIRGANRLPGTVNYLKGRDPEAWYTDLPTYAELIYEDLYPGIALHYQGSGGLLKATYEIAPGADPGQITWRYRGATAVRVAANGNLQIDLKTRPGSSGGQIGVLTEHTPQAWQMIAGRRVPVEVHYQVTAEGALRFDVGAYDPIYPLVIDPPLTYSTYLGGSSTEVANGVAVDGAGQVYVTGYTTSADFPLANAYQGSPAGGADVFVTKLTADGSALFYSTYFGGNNYDEGYSLAVDGDGQAYVTGRTNSTDFPTANPWQAANGGGTDAFIAKFSVGGNALVYSSYLGGSDLDYGNDIILNAGGEAYLVGDTVSTNFPTHNPLQAAPGGGFDAWIAKVDAAGMGLLFSSYFGGADEDHGYGIAMGDTGAAYFTGYTKSENLPTANPLQAACAIPGTLLVEARSSGEKSALCEDVFVAQVNPTGDTLLYGTYLGGEGNDHAHSIAVDGAGNMYLTGFTDSDDFPTFNPLQTDLAGFPDAFLTKLNASGSALVYSTYLGGSEENQGTDLVVDSAGQAYLTGFTTSDDFPLVDPVQAICGDGLADCEDVFIARLNADGSALDFSSYLGGSEAESGTSQYPSLAVDAADNVYLAGGTDSDDFPTLNPLQAAPGGAGDAFIAKFGDNPMPTATSTLTPSPTYTPTPTATPVPYTGPLTITLSYDPLNRLTASLYASGEAFQYQYDAVGNREVLTSTEQGVITYTYDIANRLTHVNGVPQQWDPNGNLLDDGTNTYTYDYANRLVRVNLPNDYYTFAYNGLGDRVQQGLNKRMPTDYTLDLAAGLTQVLADTESHQYLYGVGRIGEEDYFGWQYHLPDALGSVRQLTDPAGGITLAQAYQPYGSVLNSVGTGATAYGFAGEWMDGSGMVYLRARYYTPGNGRFITKDPWEGNSTRPMSFNPWLYVYANPINNLDPSGFSSDCLRGNCGPDITEWYLKEMKNHFQYGTSVQGRRQDLFNRGFKFAVEAANGCSGATVFDLVQGISPFEDVVRRVGDGSTPLYIGDKAPPPGGIIGGKVYIWSLIESLQVVEYALYGLSVDYSNLTYPRVGACPSFNCDGLIVGDNWHPFVTMCGKCHDASDLGNMMFGLGGASRGLPLAFTYPSATLYNVMVDWIPRLRDDVPGGPGLFESVFSPDARGAIVGWTLGKTQSHSSKGSFCNIIRSLDPLGYRDNANITDQCNPCESAITSIQASNPSTFKSVSGIDTVGWLERILRRMGLIN